MIGFAALGAPADTALSLVPLLTARGLGVGLIKRRSGVSHVFVGSSRRWALTVDNEQPTDSEPFELVDELDTEALDVILVEGFKASSFPQIELHLATSGDPLLADTDPYIIAVATDEPQRVHVDLPVLNLNDPADIAEFIFLHLLLGETYPWGELE